MVDDQVGAPTCAEFLADVTALRVALARKGPAQHPSRVYHVAPVGETPWYDYAKFVFAVEMPHWKLHLTQMIQQCLKARRHEKA
jgi:dTDP-4-dehydrorhamnose reductase